MTANVAPEVAQSLLLRATPADSTADQSLKPLAITSPTGSSDFRYHPL